jgi:putative aldouronate transport system permease protein
MYSVKKKSNNLNKITFTSVFCYSVMVLACLSVILPFIHEFAKSLSHPFEVDTGHVVFIPKEFTLGSYKYYLEDQFEPLIRSLMNTLFLVTVGGVLSVGSILLVAYPLSRPYREFRLGPIIIYMIVFLIIFQRPIIPLRITHQIYGTLDSLWAIIFNMLIDPFMVILSITFYKNIPDDIFDAARIDGANEMKTFIEIILPLCAALIATLFLIMSIGYWNSFLQAKLLIINPEKYPIQNYIRSVMELGGGEGDVDYIRNPFSQSESIKSALLIITTVPPTIVYLSLQKYFKGGVTSGAVKG